MRFGTRISVIEGRSMVELGHGNGSVKVVRQCTSARSSRASVNGLSVRTVPVAQNEGGCTMSAHRSQSARIDLTLPSLAGLHTRRSEKWVGHDPDVISSTIAEMDFPVAEPIIRALHAAIDRHDFGYAPATIPTLAEAFAGFAARRLGWRVDPGQTTLLPDVMVGVLELARAAGRTQPIRGLPGPGLPAVSD
jgi:hypothetical protein